MMKRIGIRAAAVWAVAAIAVAPASGNAQAPPLPTDVPVWLVGHPSLDGTELEPYEDVRFTMGAAGKEGPLAFGEAVQARAFQSLSLRADRREGRDVWIRTAETFRAGEDVPAATAELVMDRRTLAPLRSVVVQGGQERVTEYAWETHEIYGAWEGSPSLEVDLAVLEAGAHETWMAAIPWRDDMRLMLPSVLGVQGGKWWAVPRVVGSEPIDIGDGISRDAWVVELDWWGMGAASRTYTPGGGVNGTAGSGGKYWVLQDPLPGMPRVVRVRTEIDGTRDSVIQLQRNG